VITKEQDHMTTKEEGYRYCITKSCDNKGRLSFSQSSFIPKQVGDKANFFEGQGCIVFVAIQL